MEKKAILFFILSFLIIVFWPMVAQKINPGKQKIEQPVNSKEKSITKKEEETVIKRIGTKINLKNDKGEQTRQKVLIAVIDTPLYRAEISNYGASIKSWKLKNYRENISKDAPNIEMVNINNNYRDPLFIDFSSIAGDESKSLVFDFDNHYLSLSRSGESKSLICSSSTLNGIKIKKIYTFYSDKYLIDIIVTIQNQTGKDLKGFIGLIWPYQIDPEGKKASKDGHFGPIALIHNKREEVEIKKIDEIKKFSGEVAWAGFEDKYFIAAMIPRAPNMFSWQVEKVSNVISSVILSQDIVIHSGKEQQLPFSAYIGPKEIDSLRSSGLHLERALHFGWLDILAKPLLFALKFFNKYFSNYGVSIIVLTVIIKFLFWPLATKSYKSMKELQRIQPRILQIRERFKNNKEQLNRELMQLYKTHKVNPMGGCLPMILQIPVFFALYYTLLGAIELRHAPFILWIKDLSAKDPYYVTPLVMGATMFIQQKMTPTAGDPLQSKIMLLMPVFFTFLFLSFPSGLVIYWLVNNILSIGQQIYINKYTK